MTGTSPSSRARELYRARATGIPIQPFTDVDPEADGYAIQREYVALLIADGDEILGYKAGLTSEPMQRIFGVSSPDYGPVLASTAFSDGDTLPVERFIAPMVEAEIVFRLRKRLTGPGVGLTEARDAIADAMPGLEIVDSRIMDWRVKLADSIADLASAGAVVLGEPVALAPDTDPRLIGCVFSRDGEIIATGAGAAALGNPVAVVAWLANTLGAQGIALEAGHLILTGALHAAVPMYPGEEFTAEFDRLGKVAVRVAKAD